MNIVCATDDNFVQHCSIMLTSLLVNNSDVQIYVLTEGLKPENEKIIREEIEDKGGKVHFCIVDSSIVEKFPMPDNGSINHISRATYYRLLIPDLLPLDVDKAIYLDCDIIINGSLEELWKIDLTDNALGVVRQIGYGFEAERLGYPIEYGYFNAGVNLINITYWRQNNVTTLLMNYIADNFDKIKFHDQDTLNAVLHKKCLRLPSQWNMTSAAYMFQIAKRGDKRNGVIIEDYALEKESAYKYRKNPIVIHYVSKPKPWSKNCVHPLYHLYYDYAKKTINYSNIKKQDDFSRSIAVLKDWGKNVISAIKQSIKKTDLTRM